MKVTKRKEEIQIYVKKLKQIRKKQQAFLQLRRGMGQGWLNCTDPRFPFSRVNGIIFQPEGTRRLSPQTSRRTTNRKDRI